MPCSEAPGHRRVALARTPDTGLGAVVGVRHAPVLIHAGAKLGITPGSLARVIRAEQLIDLAPTLPGVTGALILHRLPVADAHLGARHRAFLVRLAGEASGNPEVGAVAGVVVACVVGARVAVVAPVKGLTPACSLIAHADIAQVAGAQPLARTASVRPGITLSVVYQGLAITHTHLSTGLGTIPMLRAHDAP